MLQIGFTFSWFVHPYAYMQQVMSVVVLFVRDKCLLVYILLSFTLKFGTEPCAHIQIHYAWNDLDLKVCSVKCCLPSVINGISQCAPVAKMPWSSEIGVNCVWQAITKSLLKFRRKFSFLLYIKKLLLNCSIWCYTGQLKHSGNVWENPQSFLIMYINIASTACDAWNKKTDYIVANQKFAIMILNEN